MALLEGIRKAISLLCIHPGSSSSAEADFLTLSERSVHSIHDALRGENVVKERLNERQYEHLYLKLSKTVHSIQELVFLCGGSSDLFRPALENLYRVLEKAKLLVSKCCKDDWITEAVFQIGNAQDFQLILLEVGLCYHAIYEQAKEHMRDAQSFRQCEDLRSAFTFRPLDASEVGKDQDDLKQRLEDVVSSQHNSPRESGQYRQHCLARYLLETWKCMSQQSQTDELDLSRVMLCMKEIESTMKKKTWGRDRFRGYGSSGAVCSSKWLGMRCAKKVFYGNPDESSFLKEAGLLFRLNHPNIVKFFCCANGKGQGDCFIAMELMDTSLAHLIRDQAKRGDPFPLSVAVEIMVQIACAMCYLHGMGVAHRDLKPDNVVVNKSCSDHTTDLYRVKLVDFGLSKVKVEASKSTQMTAPGIGTTKYRAPEAHPDAHPDRDALGKVDWFRADVYSFGITCAHLLSLEEPSEDIKKYVELMNGSRPDVPPTCPGRLVALLNNCWDTSPRSRPNFREIWDKLEEMRHELLRGLASSYVGFEEFIRTEVELHFGARREVLVGSTNEIIESIPTSGSMITSGMENMDDTFMSDPRLNVSNFHSIASEGSLSLINEDVIVLDASTAICASVSQNFTSVEPLPCMDEVADEDSGSAKRLPTSGGSQHFPADSGPSRSGLLIANTGKLDSKGTSTISAPVEVSKQTSTSTSSEDDKIRVGKREGSGELEEGMREPKRAFPLDASTSAVSGAGGTSKTLLEIEMHNHVQSDFGVLSQFDVFLNHREPDLKKTFVSHLSAALRRAGRRPFMDGKSLMKGHPALNSINEALPGVLVHVVIFSPRYAESKYCLNELCAMLTSGKPLIPVFYNVEPVHLRWVFNEKGPFAEAFRWHMERGRHEDVERWKEALKIAATITGFRFADSDSDAELEEKIVAAVLDAILERTMDNHVQSDSKMLKQYDVFLHHRGPDLKRTFVSQLYAALRRAGCNPFLDVKSLVVGKPSFHSILDALDSALVHVAIISRGFAESKDCLDGLCDALKTSKLIFPVFYDVEPVDLQIIDSGPFAHAFCIHEERGRHVDVERWKGALKEVASIPGFSLVDCDNDTVLLEEKIVAAVLNTLQAPGQ